MDFKAIKKITGTYLMQIIFLFLNFTTALYLYSIFAKTTDLINYKDDAREFLEQIQYIPVNPEFIKNMTLILFLLLFILSITRELYKKYISINIQTLFILMDICICSTIMYFLNMGNKEILLIPIVHILLYLKGRTRKTILTIIVVILYTLLDSDFLSIPYNMIPIKEYIDYQSEQTRLTMYGIKSVMISLNYIWFIFFIFLDIQFKIEENRKVEHLNSALKSSLKNLEIANAQLIEYSKKSEDLARVKERNRLAREIHDTVGHTLIGIELGLKACRNIYSTSPKRLLKQIDSISELATKGSKDIRLSLKALKPDALQRYSMIPALKSMIEQINNCGDIKCHLILSGNIPRLVAKQEELIYRIAQEGITNSIRHGKATEIKIGINFTLENIYIVLDDNGKGCESIKEGFGLTHLREGVEFFMGTLKISQLKESGLSIKINLPLSTREGEKR